MTQKNEVFLVGGYYSEEAIKNQLKIEGMSKYDLETLRVYSSNNIEDVEKLGFVETVHEYFNENYLDFEFANDDFNYDEKESEDNNEYINDYDFLANEQKFEVIAKYVKDDEIACLELFDDEDEAYEYYVNIIEERMRDTEEFKKANEETQYFELIHNNDYDFLIAKRDDVVFDRLNKFVNNGFYCDDFDNHILMHAVRIINQSNCQNFTIADEYGEGDLRRVTDTKTIKEIEKRFKNKNNKILTSF